MKSSKAISSKLVKSRKVLAYGFHIEKELKEEERKLIDRPRGSGCSHDTSGIDIPMKGIDATQNLASTQCQSGYHRHGYRGAAGDSGELKFPAPPKEVGLADGWTADGGQDIKNTRQISHILQQTSKMAGLP